MFGGDFVLRKIRGLLKGHDFFLLFTVFFQQSYVSLDGVDVKNV